MTTVGAAVGPAIAAGLRSLFARDGEDEVASRPREEDEAARAEARTGGVPAGDQATRVDQAPRAGRE